MKTRKDFSITELQTELAARYPDVDPQIIKVCSYIWHDIKTSLRVKHNGVIGAVALAKMTGLSYNTVRARLLEAGVPSVLTPKGYRRYDSSTALAALAKYGA